MQNSFLRSLVRHFRLVKRAAQASIVFLGSIAIAIVILIGGRALAQQASGDQLKQLQQMLGNSDEPVTSRASSAEPQNDEFLQPQATRSVRLPESRLEQIISTRAGTKLRQFGYDQIGTGQPVRIPQTGGVQNNYVLGPGDELIVSLRGQENNEYRTIVDRDGRVVLPRLNPISAAGRTLADFQADIAVAVRRAFISTQVFVSVGRIRQVSVLVAGEVNNPGGRILTGLSTPLDAILLSGGIKKSGSLRNIKLMRAGQEIAIDLYSVLTQHGRDSAVLLADGDRIIVPTLGATAAVTGWVRRPGIYELAPGQHAISTQSLLSLAGGMEVRGEYRLSVLRFLRNGSNAMVALKSRSGTIGDSEILFVQQSADKTEDQATLSGGTALAGVYSVGKTAMLSDILKAPGALGQSPYTLFGIMMRRDPDTQLTTLKAITPAAVLNGTENLALMSGDTVRVFSSNEARLLSAVVRNFEVREQADQDNLLAPQVAQKIAAPQGSGTFDSAQTPQDRVLMQRTNIAALSDMILGNGGMLVPLHPTVQQSPNPQPSQGGQTTQQVNVYTAAPSARDRMESAGVQQTDLQPGQEAPSSDSNGYQNDMDRGGSNRTTDQYSRNMNAYPDQNFEDQVLSPGQVPTNRETKTFGQIARQLNIDPLVLMEFLQDNEVLISGALNGPGNYIVGPHATMRDLVLAAGGILNWTDRTRAELISTTVDPQTGRSETHHELLPISDSQMASYTIKPHDDIHLNSVYADIAAGSVNIQGQVRYPGVYQISSGRHLSDLLLRAGGLTDVAYPYGTVFLRKSAAAAERDGYLRTAREVENSIVAAMTQVGTDKVAPETYTGLQSFITELKTQPALGRIPITADPAVLAADPSKDVLLEAGDVVFIPQRPSSVAVLGEVLKSGSVPFSSGKTVADYIDQSGGYGPFADKSLTFIILPDGSAHRVDSSWLNFDVQDIPPGSSVVVPRDVSPLFLRQIILDAATVLSQLAISAASLSVISSNK